VIAGSAAAPPVSETFRHEALFYKGSSDYLAGTMEFIQTGLRLGEPVFVAVPGAKFDLLSTSLDGAGDRVQFADMAHLGRNPARIIPAIRGFTDDHRDRRVRFIGEPIWAGRSPAESREATRHEALLNEAFAQTPMTVLCPYDTRALDAAVIADAWHNHPVVLEHETRRQSATYTDPAIMYAAQAHPLERAPQDAAVMQYGPGDLHRVRTMTRRFAGSSALSDDQTDDLVAAVNEIASNSLLHAGGAGTLRLWRTRTAACCEISDAGHITDALAGRRAPGVSAEHGRGLWMANQFCDLTEIRSDQHGTIIRLHISVV
jgi:anti-sigma regulatory factor (Ser/Thr protein kinase)